MATISEALAIAIEHHQGGRLQAAEQIYRQILQVEPNHADALHLLGVIAAQFGKHDIAVEYMGRATQLDPANAMAHNNLGNALMGQGKLEEAVASYRRALQLKPDYSEAHYNLGVALKEQGKLDEAVACYRRALASKPDYADAHNNLGIALKEQGKLDEAVACYRRALRLKPDSADAHINLGNALKDQGKLDDALVCYRQALALQPDYAEAHNNLGNALMDQGNLDEAVACYRRALALKPDFTEAHNNLGNALSDQGKLDEAVACCRRALALNPDYAEAYNNLGVALKEQGKPEEAVACFRRALALKADFADVHLNQSILMLLIGDFVRGWGEYEWRWKVKPQNLQRRDFSEPLWDGQPLGGRTILLHAEQGLGDTIQFVRYVPLVKERGGRVVLECQPSLLPLVADFHGIDQLAARGDRLPAFEVQAPLLSLPWILGTTLDSIPAHVPYLQAEPERVQSWRKKLAPLAGFKLGIVWQGNSQYKSDRQRSIPLSHFEALARMEGVRLVSLQKGPGANQLDMLAASIDVLDLGQQLETFGDTAAVLNNLDLVVTADTAVAHLAGALGVPVWLAPPLVPDWRWLLTRADSPWYPQHRLFRQNRPGDWSEVFERIAEALSELVRNRTAAR